MKRITCLVLFLLIVVSSEAALAGPKEELAEFWQQRAGAFDTRSVENVTATYADDAVYISTLTPFRIEGKQAIRGFFADLFDAYPTIKSVVRQPLERIYNDGTMAVADWYQDSTLIDRDGHAHRIFLRVSYTLVKERNGWVIVENVFSRLPQ